MTAARSAPSAIRIPNSEVRVRTAYDTTANRPPMATTRAISDSVPIAKTTNRVGALACATRSESDSIP